MVPLRNPFHKIVKLIWSTPILITKKKKTSSESTPKTKTKCTSIPSIRTNFWLVIFIMAVSKDATNSAKYDFDVFCKCWACLLVAKSFIFVKWDKSFLENCIVYLIKRKFQLKRVSVQGQCENGWNIIYKTLELELVFDQKLLNKPDNLSIFFLLVLHILFL